MKVKNPLSRSVLGIFSGLAVLLVLIAVCEGLVRIVKGAPEKEYEDTDDFYYAYVDPYDGFFKKVERDGVMMYENVRKLRNNRLSFPVNKGEGVFRVFIVGGSVAANFDTAVLSAQLEQVLPSGRAEVINCSMGGYDSRYLSIIFREVIGCDPDLVIIMSGNNEYRSLDRVPLIYMYPDIFRARRLLNRSWLFRMAKAPLRKILFREQPGKHVPNYLGRIIRAARFRTNIQGMVDLARRKGVPILLSTLPVNYKYPPQDLDVELIYPIILDREALAAKLCLERGEYSRALAILGDVKKKMQYNPYVYYYMAKAYEAIGKYREAKNDYIRAISLDVPTNRAAIMNLMVRDISSAGYAGLVDLQGCFDSVVPDGLADFRLFYDVHHFNDFLYRDIVAKEIAVQVLKKVLGLPVPSALRDYTAESVMSDMRKQRSDKEYYIWGFSWFFAYDIWTSELTFNAEFLLDMYGECPDLIEDFLDIEYLKKRMRKIFEENVWTQSRVPLLEERWHKLFFIMGEMYRRLGKYDIALRYFDEAIRMRPDIEPHAFLFRGIARLMAGDGKGAREDFRSLRSRQPPGTYDWLEEDFHL